MKEQLFLIKLKTIGAIMTITETLRRWWVDTKAGSIPIEKLISAISANPPGAKASKSVLNGIPVDAVNVEEIKAARQRM